MEWILAAPQCILHKQLTGICSGRCAEKWMLLDISRFTARQK